MERPLTLKLFETGGTPYTSYLFGRTITQVGSQGGLHLEMTAKDARVLRMLLDMALADYDASVRGGE